MDWNKIQETICEIQDIQTAVTAKLKDPVFNEITYRFHKIANDMNILQKDLRDAVLENKYQVTPLQIILIEKINDEGLARDISTFYNMLPEDINEIESYVNKQKEKYILVSKTLDLIIDIETLAETENEEDTFESNEYMKMYELEISMDNPETKESLINEEETEARIIKQLSNYISSLSEEERANLYIQTFALSYNKNRAVYFAKHKVKSYYLKNNMFEMLRLFEVFNLHIKVMELTMIQKEDLETICENLSCIYKSPFYKQKVKKKEV